MTFREPIVSVLGHVDHGKTELLDTVNKTDTSESGNITQNVKTVDMSKQTIDSYISNSYDLDIPGIIWIDTPGHGSFTHSRKKGSQLADISVLVIDVTSGLQPQTEEALDILSESQTPFIVALNKIDKLPGWNGSLNNSGDTFQKELKNSAYEVAGSLSEYGFNANIYSEINDFSNTISLVPISALEDKGIGKICEILVGIAQEYLKNQISKDNNDNMKAEILDITNQKGFGEVVNILLYEGNIKINDKICVNNHDGSSYAKVKRILKDRNGEFVSLDKIESASFGSIVLNADNVTEASSISQTPENVDISNKLDSITDKSGIVVSTNTTDKLIPVIKEFQNNDFSVHSGSIGKITKYDVIEASTMNEEHNQCVIGFNVEPTENAQEFSRKQNIKLIYDSVIHNLINNYSKYYEEVKNINAISGDDIMLPSRIRVIPDLIFNVGEPAIVGVEIQEGILKNNSVVKNDNGCIVGKITSIKQNNNEIEQIKSGQKSSIKIKDCKVGRDISESENLFIVPPEDIVNQIINDNIDNDIDNNINKLAKKYKSKFYQNKIF